MKLTGKTALVTGSDSGIGQATAIRFAQEGADVAIHYHSDEAGAEETAEAVERAGQRYVILQADLSEPNNAPDLWQRAEAELGPIDILVNNAGTGASADNSLEISVDDFMRVLHVDLVSPFLLIQAAVREMRTRRSGVIINVTSVHEEIPTQGDAAYAAAKGGLRNITRTLAVELAPSIRIVNIAPGLIETPMTEEKVEDPEKVTEAREKIPMDRPGQPEEVANMALFLASEEASYITGSTFFVDGGLMQRNTGA